jgi:RapZ-like N-terminal domain
MRALRFDLFASHLHSSSVYDDPMTPPRSAPAAKSRQQAAQSASEAKKPEKELVIVTGISGAGKASALKDFEDLGYHAVDNLPLELLTEFAGLVGKSPEIERAAIVVDVREGQTLDRLPEILKRVKQVLPTRVVFPDAQMRCWSGATPRRAGRIRCTVRKMCSGPLWKSGSCWIRSAMWRTR